jgi:hypothetical protein
MTPPVRQLQLSVNGHGTTYGVFEPPTDLGLGDAHTYDHRFKVSGEEYQISYSVGFLKLGGAMKPALFAPSQEAMVFFCLSVLNPVKASWYIDPLKCGLVSLSGTDEDRKRLLAQITHKMIGDKWNPGVAICVKYLPKPVWEITVQEHGW